MLQMIFSLIISKHRKFYGRIDPAIDWAHSTLVINAVHAEPGTLITSETGQVVSSAIEELARFLGATMITYSHQVPGGWKHLLT